MNKLFSKNIWQDCVLLYSPEQKLYNNIFDNKSIENLLNRYKKSIKKEIECNVWYDTKNNITFGMDQNWINSDSTKSSFISSHHDFLKSTHFKNKFDLNFVLKFYGSHFGTEYYYNDEIVTSKSDKYNKFQNSKILVLAGGPSAKNYNWDEKNYDFVFSCNHFYLNPKINKIDVDFAVIGGEIDMSEKNTKFHNYFENNNTLLCFEDRMCKKSSKYFAKMKNKYQDRCVYMHSRYRGKPGVGTRLLLYAAFMRPSEIHFAGIDGMAPNTKRGDLHDHAFQTGKRYSHDALNYGVYRRHYVLFWDYIINYLKLNDTIKFQNLGEGMDRNQSTSISKAYFPLEKNE